MGLDHTPPNRHRSCLDSEKAVLCIIGYSLKTLRFVRVVMHPRGENEEQVPVASPNLPLAAGRRNVEFARNTTVIRNFRSISRSSNTWLYAPEDQTNELYYEFSPLAIRLSYLRFRPPPRRSIQSLDTLFVNYSSCRIRKVRRRLALFFREANTSL